MRRPPSTLQKLPHRSGEVPAQQGIGCPERHCICVCIVRSAPPACGHLPIAMGRLWAGGAKAKILEDFRFRLSAKLFLTIHRIGKITSPPLRTSTGHRSPATLAPENASKKSHLSPSKALSHFCNPTGASGRAESAARRGNRETKPKSENTIYDVFDTYKTQHIDLRPLDFPHILWYVYSAPFGGHAIRLKRITIPLRGIFLCTKS